ncbi:MAG: 50S ribosomal protein L9 [Planctomycetota bacterium]|nr:MAG: 50S ribosomal protein L9 [Planctomycetota bacterium]
MPQKRKERVRSADRKGGIELLLTEHIQNVGDQGQIVKVKPGYARNYLLPLGLATVATEANKAMVARHRQRQEELAVQKLKALRQTAEKIKDYSVTLEANATEDGHLYGSIGATDISKSLKAANYPVEPDMVKLEGALKELGMYTVKLQLHADISTEVKVWVVPTASSIR